MTTELRLDLADIQGNIIRGYRTPIGRFVFLHFDDFTSGRRVVNAITDEITTAVEWDGGMPESTVNIAFTFDGLDALGISRDALEGFSPEFRQGMRMRARSIGDLGESDPELWEAVWKNDDVHALVLFGSRDRQHVETRQAWLASLCSIGGVRIIGTQDAGALVIDGKPSNKEHFGFSDGFGNPDFASTGLKSQPGGGKPNGKGGWDPVKIGELLLGHGNEKGEIAPTPKPPNLFRNGTYLVYRKLHQKVGSFRRWLTDEGSRYAGGPEMLAAKMVGRWRDGTPLALSAHKPDPSIVADNDRVINFTYADDPQGLRCPLGSHVRRANPRDGLGFGTLLTEGRRITRRGMCYGPWTPADQPGDDDGEHGVIFMVLNASIAEQFEFVQSQWINYGNDFQQGNDTDPLLGNRSAAKKMVIPGDGEPGGTRPHVCFDMPQFVVTRGGDYFFMPSVTGLRWITQSRDDVKPSLIAFDETGIGDDTIPESEPHESVLHHLADGVKAWVAHDPERIFRVLRRVNPILTVKGLTLVLRYDDVQEVLQRDTIFQVPYADGFRALTGGRNFFLGMADSAEYQRDVSNMRSVVRREDLGTRIMPVVAAAADRVVANAGGRIDTVALGREVVTEFVADYIGVPSPTPDAFFDASNAISGYLFLSAEELRAPAQKAAGEMLTAIRAAVAARKRARGQRDDVIERCLVLQDAGVPGMDDETLFVNLFGIIVGAIPTTVAMATRAIDDLLERPDELSAAHQAAARGDTATVTRYVSEAMRFSPLGPGVPRVVLQDYTLARGTLRETTLKAGARVLASLQSATFDDHKIEKPHEFRIDRPDHEYMHFGFGMHTCFGSHINMVQIPRIVQSVLARPGLRRADGPDGTMRMAGPFPAGLVVEYD